MTGNHVYVVTWEGGPLKIGHSRSPEKRKLGFQTAAPFPLIIARTWHRPDGDAEKVERLAHGRLKAARLQGEWFHATVEEAVAAIEAVIEEMANPAPPPPQLREEDLDPAALATAKAFFSAMKAAVDSQKMFAAREGRAALLAIRADKDAKSRKEAKAVWFNLDLTAEEVAKRTGYSKRTMHRWWGPRTPLVPTRKLTRK